MDVPQLDEIDEVLAAYALERRGVPEPVASGTLNWNYRVETAAGTVFVRRHRPELDVNRIAGEHAVIDFAATHGIPVAKPLKREGGATTLVSRAGTWAVFPWVDGHVPVRGAVTPAQAYALGEMHSRIHAAFAKHPASHGATFQMRWDKAETLALLATCIGLARERHEPAVVQHAMAFQRDLLERTQIEPPSHFASLPTQLTHGDFHGEQVLFASDGSIAAVTDWEMYQTTSRAFELIRALGLSQLLHKPEADDYLRGYREHNCFTAEECRLGVQLWWQSRVNGAWVWYAYFVQGNERVAGLFPEILPELERLADPGVRERLVERLMRVAGSI